MLPDTPGVYRYFDAEGTIIYVGKAKNLKRRVSQYFRPEEQLDRKTRALVSNIADLSYTVVETEEDFYMEIERGHSVIIQKKNCSDELIAFLRTLK